MTHPAAPQDDLLPDDPLGELSEDQRHKVEEFIEEEEGSFNRYKGWLAAGLTALAVATSAFHLYAAYGIVRTDLLRGLHFHLQQGVYKAGEQSSNPTHHLIGH